MGRAGVQKFAIHKREFATMSDLQVTCATKTNRSDYELIRDLGGPGWRHPKAELARQIDSGINQFFTQSGSYKARLRTFMGRLRKYVKTESDPTPANNLLNLPNCP